MAPYHPPRQDAVALPWARPDRRRFLGVTAVLTALVVAGCSSSKPPAAPTVVMPPMPAPPAPPPPPGVLAGTITAAANLNPSVSQRPSPLVVRVYELRAGTAFAKADFTSLHQADLATLGADLVLRDEFMLQPGESRPWQRTLAPDTRFIALFGAYRDVERAVWRASAAVQPNRKQTVVIRADALALSITVQP